MATGLQTEYEYIRFVAHPASTPCWRCYSNEGMFLLGFVEYHGPWKQFCFYPASNTLHSAVCLRDIADFLEQLNKIYADEL